MESDIKTETTTLNPAPSALVSLWRLVRPHQWVKSGFVLMGVLFDNAWRQPQTLKSAVLAAIAFALAASGVYIINDFLDRAEDAHHPTKRFRPLVAQTVSTPSALLLLLVLWLAAAGLGYLVSLSVLLILLAYVGLTLCYSLGLKAVVLLDVFIIAAGFMLRILAGTTGIGIAPSQWLLLCGFMLSLFLGFAKRRAELYAVAGTYANRRVLEHYQPVLLDKMIVVTATCVILAYSLYTMSEQTIRAHHTPFLIYTVPFVVYGIFRYIYLLHQQRAGSEPAQEIFRDRHILISIVCWLALTIWLIS